MSLRKLFAAAASLIALALPAVAQQPFAVLSPPQPAEGGGKIEVIEFFWYGCPHCYSLEPEVNAWAKKQAADVVFKRVHAVPNEQWRQAASIFYTLEAMGLLEQYHQKVFDAFHKDNKNLANERIRDEWLQANGIDLKKYKEVEKSFSVATKLNRARQMTENYKVDGVPRIFVNGKYYTAAEFAGSNSRIFTVVDQLVAQERKAMPAAAATPAKAPAPAPAPAKK